MADTRTYWPGTDAPYAFIAERLGVPVPTTTPTTGSVDIAAATGEIEMPEEVVDREQIAARDRVPDASSFRRVDADAFPGPIVPGQGPVPQVAMGDGRLPEIEMPEDVVAPLGVNGAAAGVATTTESQAPVAGPVDAPTGEPSMLSAPPIPFRPVVDVLDRQDRYRDLATNVAAIGDAQARLERAGGELEATRLEDEAALRTASYGRAERLRLEEEARARALAERQARISAQVEEALAEVQRVSRPPARGDYTAAVAMAALASGAGAEAGARMILATIEQRVGDRQRRWENSVAGARTRLTGLGDAMDVLNKAGIGGRQAYEAQVAVEAARTAQQIELNSSYYAPDRARLAGEMAASLRLMGVQELTQKIIKDRVDEEDRIQQSADRRYAASLRGRGGGGGGRGTAVNPDPDSPFRIDTGIDVGDGATLFARVKLGEPEQAKLRTEVQYAQDVQFQRAELRSRMRAHGLDRSDGSQVWRRLTKTAQKEIEDLYEEMVQAEVKAISGAAATDSERAQIRGRMPGLRSWMEQSNPISRLDAIERRNDEKIDRHIRSYGVDPTPLTSYIARDRTGRPEQDDDGDGVPNSEDPDFGRPQEVPTGQLEPGTGPGDPGAVSARESRERQKAEEQAERRDYDANRAVVDRLTDRWGDRPSLPVSRLAIPEDAPPAVFSTAEELQKDRQDLFTALRDIERLRPDTDEHRRAAAQVVRIKAAVDAAERNLADQFGSLDRRTQEALVRNSRALSDERRSAILSTGRSRRTVRGDVVEVEAPLRVDPRIRLRLMEEYVAPRRVGGGSFEVRR